MFYSACFNTTASATGTPAMDFKAAQASFPKLFEMGIQIGAATASTFGIGRSSNTPVQTNTAVLLAEDGGNTVAGQTTQAVTWSTAPTIPTIFSRNIILNNAIGQSVVFTWPRGFSLSPAAASLVVWNQANNSNNTNVWAVLDE